MSFKKALDLDVRNLSRISESNATIYNSKTAKGGIVQKKAKELFWGLPGICRP